MYTLIVTAKMNDINPQAWLADVLARLPNITVSRVHELLPWNWKAGLGSVDVHRSPMTVDAREINALKLVSVLQHLVAIPLYSLSFPKKFSIR